MSQNFIKLTHHQPFSRRSCTKYSQKIPGTLSFGIIRLPIKTHKSPHSYTRNGYYSVKSAYHVARELEQQQSAQMASTSSTVRRNWNFIWKLGVPNKIRVFYWRMLRNGLHVLQNLDRRNIQVDNLCPLCLDPCETVIHILKLCHFAKLVWALFNLSSNVLLGHSNDIWEWISNVKQGLKPEEFELFTCIYWSIWYARNSIMHDKKEPDPVALLQFTRDYLTRFREAKAQFDMQLLLVAPQTWSPPQGEFVKINTDAAILQKPRGAGLGIVARDVIGDVIAWRQRFTPNILCPESAEFMAILEGVKLARDFGWRHYSRK